MDAIIDVAEANKEDKPVILCESSDSPNGGAVGDASVELEGLGQKIAPTSSVMDITLVNLVMVNTAELLLQKGLVPPVFTSANTDEGDSANKSILETYKPRIPSL